MSKSNAGGHSLARDTLIVMAGYLASKAVGVVREPLIGRAFGTGEQLDAYYAAFKIPDLLFTLIAGGALVTVFIPLFAETHAKRGEEPAWRMASAVLNLVMLATLVVSFAAGLLAPQIVACCVAPGFTPAQQSLTVDLMHLIFGSTILFALSGVVMGILNARQHFLTPAFAPVLYNLGIIGGAVFLSPRYGIQGLAYGVIIGSVFYLLIHLPALFRAGFRYTPTLMLRDPVTGELVRLMLPRILALGVLNVNSLVATNLASRLESGSISALNFAWIMMQLPETVIATAIATAVFPTLARYAAAGHLDQLRAATTVSLRAILLLSLPAMVGLLLLGQPLISILFQGGRFDENSTRAVVWALNFYTLGLIGTSFLEIGDRVFYAQKDMLTPLFAAGVGMVTNAALAVSLMGVLGHGGIALANAAAVSVDVCLVLWIASRRLGGIGARSLADAAGRALPAAAVMAALLWAAERLTASSWILLLAGGLATGVYFVVLWLTGVPEARDMLRTLVHFPGRLLRPEVIAEPLQEAGE